MPPEPPGPDSPREPTKPGEREPGEVKPKPAPNRTPGGVAVAAGGSTGTPGPGRAPGRQGSRLPSGGDGEKRGRKVRARKVQGIVPPIEPWSVPTIPVLFFLVVKLITYVAYDVWE